MSVQDFGAGVPNASSDALIQKNYPGVVLNGTEALGNWTEDREVNGSRWFAIVNATWNNATNGGFSQVNSAVASSAASISPAGVITVYTAAAGAPSPIVWSSRLITSSVVPLPFAEGGTNTTFAPSAIPLPTGSHNVVAGGDSITLGANGSGGFVATPYVQLVAAEFAIASGGTWTPVNLGISGTSLEHSGARGITDGIDRWNVAGVGGLNSLLSYAQADPLSYFILAYGINDMGEAPSYGFSPAQFFANYATVIEGLIIAGVAPDHIILMGLTYINVQISQSPTYTTPSYAYEYVKAQYTEQVAALALRFQTRYAEMESYMAVNGAETLLNADGLHPAQSGHNLLALGFENATFFAAIYGTAIARVMQMLTAINGGPLTPQTTQLLSWAVVDQYNPFPSVVAGLLMMKLGIQVAVEHGITLLTTDASNFSLLGRADNSVKALLPTNGMSFLDPTQSFTYFEVTRNGNFASFDGTHIGNVLPVFNLAGTRIGNTAHEFIDEVAAVGASTTVTFPAGLAFSVMYLVTIVDETSPGTAVFTSAKSLTAFTFASTTGHTYSYNARGA